RKQHAAVVALGLDGMGEISDGLGRGVADDLLRSVAAVLEQTLRQGDTIGRLDDADEFTILLSEIASAQDVAQVAEKIRQALRVPFLIGGHELGVTASLGVALFPEDGPEPEGLIESSHVALRQARQRGGDRLD